MHTNTCAHNKVCIPTHVHTIRYWYYNFSPQLFRGPFASAMGKVWHPEHFVCSDCNKPLQNTTFVFEEEKIYCDECYQKNFAQICHSCQKSILGVSPYWGSFILGVIPY